MPCALIKLLQGYLSVPVCIHLSEDLLHSFLCIGLLYHDLNHLGCRGDNIQHLFSADGTILVNIIHVERQLQLLLDLIPLEVMLRAQRNSLKSM